MGAERDLKAAHLPARKRKKFKKPPQAQQVQQQQKQQQKQQQQKQQQQQPKEKRKPHKQRPAAAAATTPGEVESDCSTAPGEEPRAAATAAAAADKHGAASSPAAADTAAAAAAAAAAAPDPSACAADPAAAATPAETPAAAAAAAAAASLFAAASYSKWAFLHLRLRRSLLHHGFTKPTKIQLLAIPTLLHGHDTLIQCPTGMGKTLCLAVPLLQRVLQQSQQQQQQLKRSDGTRAIVLLPTRELALQAAALFQQLTRIFPWLTVSAVIGGESRKKEKQRLRLGTGVLLGTPGRLQDHLSSTSSLRLLPLLCLLLDEADRLLDLGFEAKLRCIYTACLQKIRQEQQLLQLRREAADECAALQQQQQQQGEAEGDSDDEQQQLQRLRRLETEHEGVDGPAAAATTTTSSSSSSSSSSGRGHL
ncbi:hypothetical protein ETH_00025560 [Eimeria tenella]|uniref:ATP-dependent RNA helicase n=1 Tax=Eimeria tenella TaxID=5802 RepID=U6KIQ8_EIMTE|nr:hypothetical protein ETH_00025560 [Eimeria tenella]CDJ37890.1 hypothetical protein ETH_00025560 [Eimeria tenella]|eukprot:XP_013228728.1 hypothetical protein ETH_00025560 [Eimeria tenella]